VHRPSSFIVGLGPYRREDVVDKQIQYYSALVASLSFLLWRDAHAEIDDLKGRLDRREKRRKGNFIGIIGNWRSMRFGRAVLRGFRNNSGLPVESLFLPFDGWILPETRLSDHASFWDAGLPALMVTDTAFFRNPNYHLPSDTIDTLDFDFMAQLVKSLEIALLELPL